ncbi:MAG: POTRA domain-containing protein, partial [Elusimicrobiota bacterium]
MKKLILIIGLLVCIQAISAAENHKLTGVAIQGLFNVKEKAVRSEIKSKAKKSYSEAIVKSDIQAILGTGFFDNVEVEIDTTT